MGGAVSLSPDENLQKDVVNIAKDVEAMDKLFYDIAGMGDNGRINCKTKISVPNLLNYFKAQPDKSLNAISNNQNVLIEAHKYTGIAMKNDSYYKGEQLSKKQFRLLLVTIYLFSHIWELFNILDSDISDKRLSEQEYLDGKETMAKCPGCEFIEEVSVEKWASEFSKLDKDKNGYITFDEFCSYTVTNIIKPETYFFGDIEDDEEDVENMVLGKFHVESALEAVERMEREAAEAEATSTGPEAAPKYDIATPVPEKYVKTTESELQRTVADEIAHLMRKINKRKDKRIAATACRSVYTTVEGSTEVGGTHVIQTGGLSTSVNGSQAMQ